MRTRVVILAGPSGSGKSRLAARLAAHHHWPIVRLDDFYRDQDDPELPMSAGLGIPDWDDPRSWNGEAALAALRTLVDTGSCELPIYDLPTSRAVGTTTLTAGPGDLILTEGIFAAELIGPLRAEGLLHSGWCIIHRHPGVNFLRRLARDLRERRKPPHILVRRGWALMRSEPSVIERQRKLGATCARATVVEDTLAAHRPGAG
ncbi:MAG TPA: ATP-binding protein [Phycicoccus elongatus]|mgnify:FL=1|jgi:uridine kinase|uniref:uridine kinase family protein n=1 Tax=Phycicoccus TaxID=367298 RepID=UPI001D766340|nr:MULTISPECIES: ATP-binding protein [Phycicoccus]MBK8728424.1 ATP-binding protein [Tetrasphaera sp.]MCB1239784.1 ATP-binding protein [Tetrasphaera sp.]MCB9407310.1 ATP-binding protein [Tetrasphaera sp.]MCO5302314.1 ATP-binding protein [Phycicoccus sp.]HPK11263.1 ATP-binding protein [Phycicoccus elongatus]